MAFKVSVDIKLLNWRISRVWSSKCRWPIVMLTRFIHIDVTELWNRLSGHLVRATSTHFELNQARANSLGNRSILGIFWITFSVQVRLCRRCSSRCSPCNQQDDTGSKCQNHFFCVSSPDKRRLMCVRNTRPNVRLAGDSHEGAGTFVQLERNSLEKEPKMSERDGS